jgi:transglutaminase-like putative cysteine protease
MYCQNGELIQDAPLCGCPSGQELDGWGCRIPKPIVGTTATYTFTNHDNTEPFYGMYCEKINPYDLSVRKAAADAIRNDSGSYNVVQLFDIYDWVKANIFYQNVPLAGIPYPPSDTLITKSGDCKNQAVLIASMVEAIGGTAEVVADPSCVHAYAIVKFADSWKNASGLFTQAVANHYGSGVNVNYFTRDDGIWVIFDPAGGNYPGETLPECLNQDEVNYPVTSCMTCASEYPDKPYTLGDSCYNYCPTGTIATNPHACVPCPAGDYAWNNDCYLPCPNGGRFDSGYCYSR